MGFTLGGLSNVGLSVAVAWRSSGATHMYPTPPNHPQPHGGLQSPSNLTSCLTESV